MSAVERGRIVMRRALVIVCCGLPFAVPEASLAAGGPVGVVQGRVVSAPESLSSYVAVGAGRDTVVRRVRRAGGKGEHSTRLVGRLGVAVAANDGSTTGLSADGRTLVLAAIVSTYPPRRTTLVVVGTPSLAVRARIRLRGYYAVDAISPTGRWLYLIHYVSPNRDTLRYEVRAYDLFRGHLMRQPVIDPRDRGEAMLGVAVTRVMSAGGRWAYTLYDRPGSTPFIHALDTQRRVAVCVDLPAIPDQEMFSSRLALVNRGGTLRVEHSGTPLALVSTRTFAVRTPGAAVRTPEAAVRLAGAGRRPAAARRAGSLSHGDGQWWALGAALAAALGAVTVLGRRNRLARSARG
jgi:hypothetical protein